MMLLDFLILLAKYLAFYVLPGYALVHVFVDRGDFYIRLLLTFCFSISLNTVFSLILAAFGVLSGFLVLFLDILAFFSVMGFYYHRHRPESFMQFEHDLLLLRQAKVAKAAFALACVLLVYFVVLAVRVDYHGVYNHPFDSNPGLKLAQGKSFALPLHADEFSHLSLITYVLDEKTLVSVNPLLNPRVFFNRRLNLQQGFHTYMASAFMVSSSDPVLDYRWYAPFYAALAALSVFTFMLHKTDYMTAVFSTLFFASLKSNVNLLGLWFFTPLTFSLFYIPCFFILYEKKSKLILLPLVACTASYPPASFVFLGAAVFERFTPYVYKSNRLDITAAAFLIAALMFQPYVSSFVDAHSNLTKSIPVFFTRSYLSSMGLPNYNIVYLIGIGKTFLASFGVYALIKRKTNRLLLGAFAFVFVNFFLWKAFGFTAFLPPIRTVFYLTYASAFLSAIGLREVYEVFKYKPRDLRRFRTRKVDAYLVVAFFLLAPFYNLYDISAQQNIAGVPSHKLVLIYFVDEKAYDAISFIKGDSQGLKTVLADPMVSYGVYPISKNYIVKILGSTLGSYDVDLYREYVKKGCGVYPDVEKYEVDYVLTDVETTCDWHELIYSNEFYKVYRVVG